MIAGGLVLCVVLAVLHANAVCISEFRIISDNEMIEFAIQDELKYINAGHVKGIGFDNGERNLLIADSIEFRSLNPECCKILSFFGGPSGLYSLLDTVFGNYGKAVQLKYETRYLDTKGILLKRPTISELPISSCGKKELEFYRGG